MTLPMNVLTDRLLELRVDLPVVHTVLLQPNTFPHVYGRMGIEFYQKVEGHEDESVDALANRIFQTEKELFDRFKTYSQSSDWTFTIRGDWILNTLKGGKLAFYRIVSLTDDNGVAMLNDKAMTVLPLQSPTPEVKESKPKKPAVDPLKLPSRFQPGDTVVYHVFGGDKWIGGCIVKRVSFTDGGKILYNLHVPVSFEGRNPIYCPVDNVVSEWVVTRIGEKNATFDIKDGISLKTANEV